MEDNYADFYKEPNSPFVFFADAYFPAGLLNCSDKLKDAIVKNEYHIRYRRSFSNSMNIFLQLQSGICHEIVNKVVEKYQLDKITNLIDFPDEYFLALSLVISLSKLQMDLCGGRGKQFLLDICFLNFEYSYFLLKSRGILKKNFSDEKFQEYYISMLSLLFIIDNTDELLSVYKNRRKVFSAILNGSHTREKSDRVNICFQLSMWDLYQDEYKYLFLYNEEEYKDFCYIIKRCDPEKGFFPMSIVDTTEFDSAFAQDFREEAILRDAYTGYPDFVESIVSIFSSLRDELLEEEIIAKSDGTDNTSEHNMSANSHRQRESNLKERFFGTLGMFGLILYYIISLVVSIFPSVMISDSWIFFFVFLAISYFFPLSTVVFWTWGLVCAMQSPQNAITTAYYVVTVVVWFPFFIGIVSDFIAAVKRR